MVPLIINNKQTNYLIDESGLIFNNKTKKKLSGGIKPNGYISVKLTIDGVKKDYLVHRLVAETFLKNSQHLPQVNHKDKNKLNNNVSNLEWVTASENIKHAASTRKPRQPIQAIHEDILNSSEWKQYKNSNYYFCKDGRGANVKTGKYLNSSASFNNGYLKYYLYLNNKSCSFLVHSIIYDLFGERVLEKNEQINHKDGNKQNNNINNLEAISRSDNMKHSYYVLQQNVKIVYQYDLENNLLKIYPSISQAAKENNCNISGISQAMSGKIKTYKGFYWKNQ